MVEVLRHPKVQLITNADILKVDGFVGNFRVKVRKNPRYVIADKCTGCGECKDVCPIEYPNEWDMKLGVRKAISIPFDQAVPIIHSINRDYCIECFKCVDACGAREAINFNQKPEEVELEVGAIIVTTGSDIYLPYDDATYGYGKYDNVITALEFERLITAGGPTAGHVVRTSDGKTPKSVAIIQCVGSRDISKYEYCSGFCCMYGLKEAILLKNTTIMKSKSTFSTSICVLLPKAMKNSIEERVKWESTSSEENRPEYWKTQRPRTWLFGQKTLRWDCLSKSKRRWLC